MSDIPRIPQVTPPALVNPQVHRVDHTGERQQPRKEHDPTKEDVLELHDMEEPEEETSVLECLSFGDDGSLDIAV